MFFEKENSVNHIKLVSHKWVRSKDGWIAGICQGLGERFNIDPLWFRAGWVVAILVFGIGALAYLILAFTLPREDKILDSEQPKFLGVCKKLGERFDIEIGLVRALTVFAALSSLGIVFVVYFILFFVLPDESTEKFKTLKSS